MGCLLCENDESIQKSKRINEKQTVKKSRKFVLHKFLINDEKLVIFLFIYQ